MFWNETEDLVSIIVPVYNVYDYIDRCLNSLLNQTYKKIEIILINDGSTDDSAIKCLEWAKRDERIVFVSKRNEKQGPSRNLGVQMARGRYVLFVDPDDYVAETFVEKMYGKISMYNADMGFCDYYRTDGNSMEEVSSEINIEGATTLDSHSDLIYSVSGTVWCKIVKRSLLVDNDILQFDKMLEDWQAVALMIIMADKIVQIKEPMYYYQVNRNSSSINSQLENLYIDFADCIEQSITYFVKRDLFDRYREYIKKYMVDAYIKKIYLMDNTSVNRAVIEKSRISAENVITKYFPDWRGRKVVLLGSPETRNQVKPIDLMSNYFSGKYLKRYNFTSLISIFAPKVYVDVKNIACKNSYRTQMVINDINKTFAEDNEGDCIIIDFLDERYDLAKYNNTYYSMSGDFIQTDFAKGIAYEVLSRDNSMVQAMWEESCLKLIELLKKNYRPENIYLCRNYVSEGMPDYDCSLKEEEINKLLKGYYDFFEMHMAGININN